jgi:D-alanyl-D-alanine carboxypeptidase (penicillin-binding protein 5/6)
MSLTTGRFRIVIAAVTAVCLLWAMPVSAAFVESHPENIAAVAADTGIGGGVVPAPVTFKAPARAKAMIAMDAATGDIYVNKNIKKSLPVASVSKIMTVWLVMEKIKSGKGSLNSKVKIKSKKIEKLSRNWLCGGYVLKRGATFTVKELLHLTLIDSSNAAAVQLGIWVSGSNKAFIKKMNSEAAKRGLTASSFTSACGLNNVDMKLFGLVVRGGASGANLMSAYDVAKLSQLIIKTHPGVLKISGLASAKVKGTKIINSNKFFKDSQLRAKSKSLKIDGLKTGYIKRSGVCLAATGKPEGMHRIITVTLNDPYCSQDSYDILTKIYAKNKVRLSDKPFLPADEDIKPFVPEA